jgi:hypothetical protein
MIYAHTASRLQMTGAIRSPLSAILVYHDISFIVYISLRLIQDDGNSRRLS